MPRTRTHMLTQLHNSYAVMLGDRPVPPSTDRTIRSANRHKRLNVKAWMHHACVHCAILYPYCRLDFGVERWWPSTLCAVKSWPGGRAPTASIFRPQSSAVIRGPALSPPLTDVEGRDSAGGDVAAAPYNNNPYRSDKAHTHQQSERIFRPPSERAHPERSAGAPEHRPDNSLCKSA